MAKFVSAQTRKTSTKNAAKSSANGKVKHVERSDEYDRFDALAKKLVRVSKGELDQARKS